MEDWQYKWCNTAVDDNDFFCIYNRLELKEYVNFTENLIKRGDVDIRAQEITNNFWFPFTHWIWSYNFWHDLDIGWETEWKLVRFWDHVYRFHVPKFGFGIRIDLVVHFTTDAGNSLDPAICL